MCVLGRRGSWREVCVSEREREEEVWVGGCMKMSVSVLCVHAYWYLTSTYVRACMHHSHAPLVGLVEHDDGVAREQGVVQRLWLGFA